MDPHVARRRCVGCGRVAPKHELLRIAAVDQCSSRDTHAAIDPLGRMPGRGAYLCRADAARGDTNAAQRPAATCLERANKRGAIARGLRRAIPGGLVLNDVKLVESVSP